MPDPSFRNPRTGALSAVAKYMRGQIDKPEFDRQLRGEHFFPREGTHGTRSWFGEFDKKKGDLGFHFGTEEQAQQRMIHTRDDSNRHLAERYIDARLRANNPLYYPGDVGAWDHSSESARALLGSRPYGASTREGFANIIGEKERDWLQKIMDKRIRMDHPDALEQMRQIIEKQGFDSLIYRNTVENLHGSIPGLSPRALEAYNRLQQQRLAIDLKRAEDYRKANPRSVDDMPLRDPQTQELIPFSDPARQRDYERWEKGRRPFTDEERARDFALYSRMNKIEGIGGNDPHSIIVLRPNQIRSVNAEFDPAKLSSGNLMAGTAAGAIGIGAATASEEEREPYADGGPANPRLGALSKLAARIANPIRAYHGTPHKFDKFDMSKIGTGEGAQTYGHGLYFAENPAVAIDYRDRLSFRVPQSMEEQLARDALKFHPDRDAAIQALKGDTLGDRPLNDKAVSLIESGLSPHPGSLYTVDLHVPQERLLDLDIPLNVQSPEVIRAIEGLPYGREALNVQQALKRMNIFGLGTKNILEDLASKHGLREGADTRGYGYGSRRVSENLRDAGVPGSRHLDLGSRAAGTGTRNIVMFDDAPIEIVERKAEGGMVDPDGINKEPMASGGALAMNEGGSVYERLAARVRAAFEEQEAPGFADGGDIDWNSYAQTYQQMLNPAMSGSTGLNYTEPVGAQQQQPVDPIGSRLSSFTPGSAGDGVSPGLGGPQGNSMPSSALGVSPSKLGMGIGTIASLATGVPALGMLGSALGTLSEVSEANEALGKSGAAPLGFGQTLSAIGNNLSFGLLGAPVDYSMVDNTSAMVDAARAAGQDGYSPGAGYDGPASSFGGGYGGDVVGAGEGGGYGRE
jgi:hypothetical protein